MAAKIALHQQDVVHADLEIGDGVDIPRAERGDGTGPPPRRVQVIVAGQPVDEIGPARAEQPVAEAFADGDHIVAGAADQPLNPAVGLATAAAPAVCGGRVQPDRQVAVVASS